MAVTCPSGPSVLIVKLPTLHWEERAGIPDRKTASLALCLPYLSNRDVDYFLFHLEMVMRVCDQVKAVGRA